jgi:hypothetical protein
MNEQRTTDATSLDEQGAAMEQPTSSDQADAPAPMDTRDLRDAQAAGARKASAGGRGRPPIRAEGAKGASAEPASPPAAPQAPERTDAPLFDEAAGRQLRERWLVIQTEFVDEPREAVQKADSLVAEVLKSLTETFAREREELEAGWSGSGGDDGAEREVSTEDLRQAIRRYRNFFNRLLTY